MFREWVDDYEADGVCIVFCRSWPYVLYEQPVLESFQRQNGVDMRDLDPFDERVLAHRATFLTQLLRETRQMLDEVGQKARPAATYGLRDSRRGLQCVEQPRSGTLYPAPDPRDGRGDMG